MENINNQDLITAARNDLIEATRAHIHSLRVSEGVAHGVALSAKNAHATILRELDHTEAILAQAINESDTAHE